MVERIRTSPSPAKWRERIEARAQKVPGTGCWEWPTLDHSGYGKFKFTDVDGRRRMTGTHRAAWLAYRGDIDGDLVIDHLCRNRACCNPDHLDLVTNGVNALRADHTRKRGRSGRHGGELHSCGEHQREDGYLILRPDGYMAWTCRICRRDRVNRWRARRQRAA